MTDLTSFIAGLPKAELHVHHVGSASPRIVAELAARHEGSSPVPADPALLADYFAFRDFAHFIEIEPELELAGRRQRHQGYIVTKESR